jgi:hypothetical protein
MVSCQSASVIWDGESALAMPALNVHCAKIFFDFGKEMVDLSGFGNVGLDCDRAAAPFFDFGGDILRGFGLLVIVYGNVGPSFSKSQRDGFADAPAGASDERNTTC